MEAIEFFAVIEDGIIKIPKKYLGELKKEARVLILIDKQTKKLTKPIRKTTKAKKKVFKAFKVKTKDIKFSRNEANER